MPAAQIKLGPAGKWHRRRGNGGGTTTACGLTIAGAFASRDHALDGDLCPICFTPHERDTGEMEKLEARALEIANTDAFGDDDEKTPVEPIFDGNKTTKGDR